MGRQAYARKVKTCLRNPFPALILMIIHAKDALGILEILMVNGSIFFYASSLIVILQREDKTLIGQKLVIIYIKKLV